MADNQTTNESAADYVKCTCFTVGQLRQQYGTTFAESYRNQNSIVQVLGRAGVNNLGGYIAQHMAGK